MSTTPSQQLADKHGPLNEPDTIADCRLRNAWVAFGAICVLGPVGFYLAYHYVHDRFYFGPVAPRVVVGLLATGILGIWMSVRVLSVSHVLMWLLGLPSFFFFVWLLLEPLGDLRNYISGNAY